MQEAIITKYKIGKTGSAKISASCASGRICMGYDYGRNLPENHKKAAELLCARIVEELVRKKEIPVIIEMWRGKKISGKLKNGDFCHVFLPIE